MTTPDDFEDTRWSLRRGAIATVHLSISHSRYRCGEAVIETTYRLPDGNSDRDSTSRINLGNTRRDVITQLWDRLFDMVLVARQYDVAQIIINFQRETLDKWDNDFLIAVFIVAHELQVPVSGVFDANGLVQSEKAHVLGNNIPCALGEGDDDP